MKTDSIQRAKDEIAVRRVRVKGKRKVILDESAYEALLRKADPWEPDMPAPDAKGNCPALEALAALQARDILRARRKLGLSQAELARRAASGPKRSTALSKAETSRAFRPSPNSNGR